MIHAHIQIHLKKKPPKQNREQYSSHVTDYAYASAGSIQSSDHIHHNPAQLSKRKICCCLGQSHRCWATFVSVNSMDPRSIQHETEKDVEGPAWINLLPCLRVNGFSRTELSPPLTVHDYCILSMQREGRGWFIFVYSNKQCQCSGLWQTLNWIAVMINKLLLAHLFFQMRLGKQISNVAVTSFP